MKQNSLNEFRKSRFGSVVYARELGRKFMESEIEAKRLEQEILDLEDQIGRERFKDI